MAGWKALPKEDRDWVKGLLRDEIMKQQRVTDGAPDPNSEHKIGVLAIAIDVLDKACPPGERP